MNIEQRIQQVELRVNPSVEIRTSTEGFLVIRGTINLNSLSELIYNKEREAYFRERIENGAFTEVLQRMKSNGLAPSLILNHDWSTKDKIEVVDFKCDESRKGSFSFEFKVKQNPYLLRIKGEINGFSFGFVVLDSKWIPKIDGTYLRIINKFSIIQEFSILWNKIPAYKDTKATIEQNEIMRVCSGNLKEDMAYLNNKKVFENNPELHEMKKYITQKKIEDFKKFQEREKLKKSINTLKNKPEIEKLKAEIKQLKKL